MQYNAFMLSVLHRNKSARKKILSVALVLTFILIIILLGMPITGSGFPAKESGFLHCRVPDTPPSPYRKQTEVVLSQGKFLVASRNMQDPRFKETVILLIDYGVHGAVGLIINRPTEVKLSALFPNIEGLKERMDTVYIGGPVEYNKMLLLLKSDTRPDQSKHVFEDIYVSSSKQVLQQMFDNVDAKKRFRMYAGYAGWAPMQLDQEVLRGGWHVLQADSMTIFDKEPSGIWPELIRKVTSEWVWVMPEHRRRPS